jgi:hypothetical protein
VIEQGHEIAFFFANAVFDNGDNNDNDGELLMDNPHSFIDFNM